MDRILGIVLICFVSLTTSSQIADSPAASHADAEHTAWISSTLRAIQKIKVGQTRADLLKIFTTEGGMWWPPQRQYVYRHCPYIKVLVKFDQADREQELPTDKIVEISRPYLEWSIMD